MKILITCVHYPVASGRYAFNALKRMGHDVRSTGPCTGAQIWGVTVGEEHVWIPDAPEADWVPELVIHMDSHPEFTPERVGDMPHVVYGVDNHVRDYRHGKWDHLFLGHSFGYRIGEDNVTWLPCGYDPQWFTPGPPFKDRPNDAAMIGMMYDSRAELLYALRERLPHLQILYGVGALYEHFAGAYQGAKLSLCRSAAGDVAQRIFETAAMGCLVLTDPLHDAEAVGLVDGKNCRVYDSSEHCAAIIADLQQNASQAAKIARAGQRWAKGHTWDARTQVIVDWAEAQTKPKRVKASKVESGEDGKTSDD
jgi:hypothetical protein